MADEKAAEERPEGGRPPPSQGELLAARKAAKAAKKAAKRGRDAEVRETEAIKATGVAADWAREHSRALWAALIAVVVVGGGLSGWAIWDSHQDREATQLLWNATQTATAPVGDDLTATGGTGPTYASVRARAETATERFERVLSEYPRSEAAAWARLGKGNALLQQEDADAARKVFQAVLDDSDALVLQWRALEGLAFSYELDESWKKAAEQYRTMAGIDDPRVQLEAKYHLARMKLAQGQREPALEALKDLRAELREEEAPDLPYLVEQVDQLLGHLDPGAVPAGTGTASPQLSPGEMQELMRRLQEAGAAGGGGE